MPALAVGTDGALFVNVGSFSDNCHPAGGRMPDPKAVCPETQESPPRGRKWKVAVCGPQRPAQVALGPDFTIGWDSHSADFAMTLGEFYCKGLTAPLMVEVKRDGVVFARVYDIRGRSISSLLSIPAP